MSLTGSAPGRAASHRRCHLSARLSPYRRHARQYDSYLGASHSLLLNTAWQYGHIRVLAGWWVDYNVDFALPETRARLLQDFARYIRRFKNSPALLGWSIGNEQNYKNAKGEHAASWYSLVNEMAWLAFDIEGAAKYHPVTSPNGELGIIGSSYASDVNMNYLAMWGANIYRGMSFGTLFRDYAARSRKPFWISEYGNDAYDHRRKGENQELQARINSRLWGEINANFSICAGSTLMSYSDQWWKYGSDPNVQTPGGFPMGSDPDGIADEAFWGMFAVEKNAEEG